MVKILIAVLAIIALTGCKNPDSEYQTQSSGYTAIIPWSIDPPGATAQAFYAVKDQLEKHLGEPVTEVSITGNAGLNGLKYFWKHRHEANFLYFNALKSIETYAYTGAWGDEKPVTFNDLSVYSVWKNPEPIAAVSKLSDIKTAEQLISELQQKVLLVATAGQFSAGDLGARVLSNVLGTQHNPVRRSSGTKAVETVLVGESDVVIALYSELQQYIESGELRPIFMISKNEGIYDDIVIESLSDYIGDSHVPEMGVTFGFVIPNDMPAKTLEKLDRAWDLISVAEEAKKRSILPRVIRGETAVKELQKELAADKCAIFNQCENTE